jgi:hypothetical protein
MTQPPQPRPAIPLLQTRPVATGSRVARLSVPLAKDVLRRLAEKHGVCVRPIAIRCIDTVTGQADIIEVPCGARLASKCKPCAERNRRDRIAQISEGWHLDYEPQITPDPPGEDVLALVRLRAQLEFARDGAQREAKWDQVADVDEAIAELETALTERSLRGHLTPRDRSAGERKVRSTKRRQDAPDLPRLPVERRTVGRTYTGRDGKAHRPSMLVTLTLGSHGRVHTGSRYRRGQLAPCECGHLHGQRDPLLGVPLDPDGYDYRAAACDAIHFAKSVDRWWQNLRRAAGWNIQYAGCVELQKRLAPHAHFAIRGTLPRRLLNQVAAATYQQIWWPPFDTARYNVERPPVWDIDAAAYGDPSTGEPLTTWDQALSELDSDGAEPAYVARLGSIDARGIAAGTDDARRSIRYVCKYLSKDIAEQAAPHSDEQRAHFDRLHAELATLPCSPGCANWLLYGIQPEDAKPGLIPGRCTGKVHQRATLGFSGRRTLISRHWSTKTLADIRADKRAWVRAILAGAVDGHDQAATDTRPPDPADGPRRYIFELAKPGSPGVPPLEHRILRAIGVRIRWRTERDEAKRRAAGVSANEINIGGVSRPAGSSCLIRGDEG